MEYAIKKSAEEARIRLAKEEVAARARSTVVVDADERSALQRSLDDRQAEIAMEYAKKLSASEALFEAAVKLPPIENAAERAAREAKEAAENKAKAQAELCAKMQAEQCAKMLEEAERARTAVSVPVPPARQPTPFERNLLELDAMGFKVLLLCSCCGVHSSVHRRTVSATFKPWCAIAITWSR
jgi:hypothetical protein